MQQKTYFKDPELDYSAPPTMDLLFADVSLDLKKLYTV